MRKRAANAIALENEAAVSRNGKSGDPVKPLASEQQKPPRR